MSPQRWIDLTMFIQIWSYGPSTMVEVQEEDHAFPDMDEQANVSAASEFVISSEQII